MEDSILNEDCIYSLELFKYCQKKMIKEHMI